MAVVDVCLDALHAQEIADAFVDVTIGLLQGAALAAQVAATERQTSKLIQMHNNQIGGGYSHKVVDN